MQSIGTTWFSARLCDTVQPTAHNHVLKNSYVQETQYRTLLIFKNVPLKDDVVPRGTIVKRGTMLKYQPCVIFFN